MLSSLWVCEILQLKYLQNYAVLVDFHWLGLSAHFTDYVELSRLILRISPVKRCLNTQLQRLAIS